MSRVGLIGLGNVGINLAAALVETESVDELLINSRDFQKTGSYQLDLQDLSSCCKKQISVRASLLEELVETDLVIIAVRTDFINAQTTDIRLGGLHANAELIEDIANRFKGYEGKVLMITNPVDIMSRLFFEAGNLSPQHVYGIGSNLCTQRYRFVLSRIYNVPIQEVEGQVIGEHGDSRVFLHSSTRIKGNRVNLAEEEIAKRVAEVSPLINKGAGRTRYGPIGVTVRTVRRLLGHEDGVEQLSSSFRGLYIGLPVLFNKGTPNPIFPDMDHAESLKFEASYLKLGETYAKLNRVGDIITTPH